MNKINKFQKWTKLCWPVHPKTVLDKSSLATKGTSCWCHCRGGDIQWRLKVTGNAKMWTGSFLRRVIRKVWRLFPEKTPSLPPCHSFLLLCHEGEQNNSQRCFVLRFCFCFLNLSIRDLVKNVLISLLGLQRILRD